MPTLLNTRRVEIPNIIKKNIPLYMENVYCVLSGMPIDNIDAVLSRVGDIYDCQIHTPAYQAWGICG
jgi:metal-sulfur cluster biosynthetic enzyme